MTSLRHRYRQIVLFLIVLILPSAVLVMLQWKINEGEARDQRKRAVESRESVGLDIGKDYLAVLNHLMIGAVGRMPSMTGACSDPCVAVGWWDGQDLIWPWEKRKPTDIDATFSGMIDSGESEEYKMNYTDALYFYDQALDRAKDNDGQLAAAQLLRARTLVKSGKRAEGIGVYLEMLNLPLTVTDDDGVSFAAYAALFLTELRAESPKVLARVEKDLELPGAPAFYRASRLKDILDNLGKSNDKAVREGSASMIGRLSARLKDLEETERLQEKFRSLRLEADIWQSYDGDRERWLIGQTLADTAPGPAVIAVRAEALRAGVEAVRMDRDEEVYRFEIAYDGSSGVPISDRLPGMGAMFEPVPPQKPAGEPWRVAFFPVVMLTLIAGFLLWRDTRRESHFAELRTQFVSSVSHELKTPLTSIRMFAEILQMRGDRDPRMLRDYLEIIVDESEVLTRLLNNVLDFSRIERGLKTYRIEPADLADVVRAAVRTIQYPLSEQGFVLDVNVSEDLPPVPVDRDALRQAILNLLTNAMKYSGGSREIALRLTSENAAALIEVSDRGIGIPEEEQSRIFENFYRAEIAENRDIAGTGIGLSVVAHMAEAHGGSVRVKSRPGEGSTFSLRLPLRAEVAA